MDSERARGVTRTFDLVAVGGGTGGLVTAAGAAYLGLKSALVEKAALGGDCLWTGCVPSKALIASGRLARDAGTARELGLRPAPGPHDFRAVMERMRSARAAVARHDDPERFRAMGVAVHFGAARFQDASTVEVDGVGTLRAKRFVVATGASPRVPPIPGLEEAGYWTYETVFDQNELPARVAVVGGGPIGVEFAQVFARLGARVTVIEAADRVLLQEDPDVSAFVGRTLAAEGIEVQTGATVTKVRTEGGRKVVEWTAPEAASQARRDAPSEGEAVGSGSHRVLAADEIFVAAGRKPCTLGLGLDAAGVRSTSAGAVAVDPYLRTSASRVWAVGDVTGGLQFTHAAEQMAKTALRNAVLPGRTRVRYDQVPRVTYADPEVAGVGLGEAEAEAAGGTTYRYEMENLDRAIVDGAGVGFVKVSADRKGMILGAAIVARGAGEMILPLVMARQHGLSLSQVANTVFPYPTMTEGVKRAAGAYMRSRLDSAAGRTLQRVVRWLK